MVCELDEVSIKSIFKASNNASKTTRNRALYLCNLVQPYRIHELAIFFKLSQSRIVTIITLMNMIEQKELNELKKRINSLLINT